MILLNKDIIITVEMPHVQHPFSYAWSFATRDDGRWQVDIAYSDLPVNVPCVPLKAYLGIFAGIRIEPDSVSAVYTTGSCFAARPAPTIGIFDPVEINPYRSTIAAAMMEEASADELMRLIRCQGGHVNAISLSAVRDTTLPRPDRFRSKFPGGMYIST